MGTDDDSVTIAICTCKMHELKSGALNFPNWVDNAYYRALVISVKKHPLDE